MSDRCSVSITCLAADEDKFAAMDLSFDNDVESTLGERAVVTIGDDETNACVEDHAPKDAVHIGFHGEGYEYPPGMWACDGTQFVYVASAIDSSCPVVEVRPDGTVDPNAMAQAVLFWAVYRRACETMGITPLLIATQAPPTKPPVSA